MSTDYGQKTHYVISPKRRKVATCDTPLVQLLDGQEPRQNVLQRYKLFQTVWNHQLNKIHTILNSSNTEIFGSLTRFINDPSNSIETQHVKIPIGFLQLSSNTANNLRVLTEFNRYLGSQTRYEYRAISLSSKTCTNIKSALRDIVKQFLQYDEKDERDDVGGEKDEDERDDVEDEKDDENKEDDKDDELDGFDELSEFSAQGRVNYDLDIIFDYCTKYYKDKGLNNLKIVIIVEDANSINNHVLNQLVKLLHSYSLKLPIKVIMAVSSNNISSWINANFNNENRILIDGYKFKSNDNKSLGHMILNDLFLSPQVSLEDPLLLDPLLTSIILNRFENSNNSIDALISEIKLSYMIHFYHSPLSGLLETLNGSEPPAWMLPSLRKLGSFKRHIETKLNKSLEPEDKIEIRGLLLSDERLSRLFASTKSDFRTYKLSVINVINVVYQLQQLKTKGFKQKFELYKLIVGHKLINSTYLSNIINSIRDLSEDRIFDVSQDLISLLVSNIESATDSFSESLVNSLHKLKYNTSLESLRTTFIDSLHQFFGNPLLSKSIEGFVFFEVFTMNGNSSKSAKEVPIFEEKYENLMINLVRPNLRATLEESLEDCKVYLTNKSGPIMTPVINSLFRVYKEAPVLINIYDFYVAFRQSLDKAAIADWMTSNYPDINVEKEWDSITYSWFIQSCFELMMIGLLKEKPKGDFLEKALWKGV